MVSLAIRLDEARRLLRLASPQARGLRKVVLNTKRGRRAYWMIGSQAKEPARKLRKGAFNASDLNLKREKLRPPGEKESVIKKTIGKDRLSLRIGSGGSVSVEINDSHHAEIANASSNIRIAKAVVDSFREYCSGIDNYTVMYCTPYDQDPGKREKKAWLYQAMGFDKDTMAAFTIDGVLYPIDKKWADSHPEGIRTLGGESQQDLFDEDGYDRFGYDQNGYDQDGYDRDGYNEEGFDPYDVDYYGRNRQGYNMLGYNEEGIGIDGSPMQHENASRMYFHPDELRSPPDSEISTEQYSISFSDNGLISVDIRYENGYSERQYESAARERAIFREILEICENLPDNTLVRYQERDHDYMEIEAQELDLYTSAGFDPNSRSAIVQRGRLHPVNAGWLTEHGFLEDYDSLRASMSPGGWGIKIAAAAEELGERVASRTRERYA